MMRDHRKWLGTIAAAGALAVLVAAGASFGHESADTFAKTTLEQRIIPNDDPDFRELALGPGEPSYVVREEGVGAAQAGRETRRESLLYFGQLSDFQLADEESPARVELLDFGPFSAAIRPWEALNPQIDDAMIRQVNAFAGASPVAAGDGSFSTMDLALGTGDLADSQQLNETLWVRTLLDGGPLNPGSGVNPATGGDALCGQLASAGLIADAGAPQNYTGVQDFDDYLEGPAPQHYDPDQPGGSFAAWPQYPGLQDRAQAPFEAAGLDVPFYAAIGNHDALVQGNAAANAVYESVATGCIKPMAPLVVDPDSAQQAYQGLLTQLAELDLAGVLDLLSSDPTKIALVPPDPERRFVSKEEIKDVFRDGAQEDGYGFGHIDPAIEEASGGMAGYYSWSPKPGFRLISLDSVSEAGVIGPSADGNIDHPQYLWLQNELEEATAADELVVVFSHHAIPSLTASVPDELAGPCTENDSHGHDLNPGCDADPRDSQPIHLGPDMEALMLQYPHAVAWVAGHSHVNAIEPHPNGEGGGFWSIRVAAEADWPQQTRLMEIFDNDDGTLSLFGTIIDHASNATAPAAGTPAAGMTEADLASVGRTLSANDPQGGIGSGEGGADDRNVELLIADPRSDGPGPDPEGCLEGAAITGDDGDNSLQGTPQGERIRGLRGADAIRGRGGNDCIGGGRGGDRIRAGGGDDTARGGRGRDLVGGGPGDDSLSGGRGADRIVGGGGVDRMRGGPGLDRILAADGAAETVRCGTGRDVALVDAEDRTIGCERVRIR